MILILTEAEDIHSDVVEAELRRRGASVCRFDWAEFPREAALSIAYRDGHKRVQLTRGRQALELTACTSAWLRRPNRPRVSPQIPDPLLQAYAGDECYQVIQDTWNALEIPWLPGPIHTIRRADNKQLQLQLATALGLEIPPTLMTNDPDAFLEFYRQHQGRLIDKLPSIVFPASQRKELPQAGAEGASVEAEAAVRKESKKERMPRVDWAKLLRRTLALDVITSAW